MFEDILKMLARFDAGLLTETELASGLTCYAVLVSVMPRRSL